MSLRSPSNMRGIQESLATSAVKAIGRNTMLIVMLYVSFRVMLFSSAVNECGACNCDSAFEIPFSETFMRIVKITIPIA